MKDLRSVLLKISFITEFYSLAEYTNFLIPSVGQTLFWALGM